MLQVRCVSSGALLGALVLYFAFKSGGFFPAPPAYAAMLLCLVLLIRMALASTPFAGISWQFILERALSLLLRSILPGVAGGVVDRVHLGVDHVPATAAVAHLARNSQ
jgi:hypothetical protein